MVEFDLNDYMTVSEAALYLGYTNANITRLIRSGELKALKRGRAYLLHIDDINTFIKAV